MKKVFFQKTEFLLSFFSLQKGRDRTESFSERKFSAKTYFSIFPLQALSRAWSLTRLKYSVETKAGQGFLSWARQGWFLQSAVTWWAGCLSAAQRPHGTGWRLTAAAWPCAGSQLLLTSNSFVPDLTRAVACSPRCWAPWANIPC